MARTPALLVPNTPEGKFYNALPDLVARVAQAFDEQFRRVTPNQNTFERVNDCYRDSKAKLEAVLWSIAAETFTLEVIQQIGVVESLNAIKRAPIFTWDERFPLIETTLWIAGKLHNIKLPIQALPNGLYRFSPTIAYALLSRQANREGALTYIDDNNAPTRIVYDGVYGICFSQDVAFCLMGDPLYAYETSGVTYGTLRDSPVQAFIGAIAFGFSDYVNSGRNWYVLPSVAPWSPAQVVPIGRGRLGLNPWNQPQVPWSSAFPWCTNLILWPEFLTGKFAEMGRQWDEYESKVQRSQWLQFGFALLAIASLGSAINSMGAIGANVQNVAQFTAAIDNLPEIDLGVAGDIASGISSGIKLASTIPDGSVFNLDAEFDAGSFEPIEEASMFDFPTDLEEIAVGFDFDIPVIDPGLLEVDLTLADIGANVIDFDDSILYDFGLEATDLIPDDFGNIFTVTGDAVQLTPEAYVKSIYIDEGGNYRDYTNNVLLSQQEADMVFNESGLDDDAVFAELANRAQGLAGNSFVAQAGPNGRPAGTPEPAAKGEVPWFQALSQEVMGWFKTVTSYSLAKEQLEKTGRYTPPYQTSPTGTPYSQVPGVPVRRADGSTVVNNGNGTQTIQYPSGQVQTVPVSVNPSGFQGGQFTPGSFGGQLIPGVNNATLLIAGAGLVAVALLARRK
jgi:hypothetical protein